MADPRIIAIDLDERTILWRSADVEQERRIAIFDLLEENSFAPQRAHADGYAGPWRIRLSVEEGRLAIALHDADGGHRETLVLSLGRFRRPIRDYFAICDSYYQAIRQSTPQGIETVDMARRGLHNAAAELLIERLDGKIAVDFDTARRLFTLICVLHIRGQIIDDHSLIAAARRAARHAHAPYSRFAVGAAVLLRDGSVVTGANFENASYGLSLCAETVALATVSASGRLREVVGLAVIGGAMGPEGGATGDAVVNPCGRCRQVINEAAQVAGIDLPIVCGSGEGDALRRYRISDLLPDAFGPRDLGLA